MRIALVSGRRIAARVREIAEELRERTGWQVDVVEAPVEIAALIPRDVLRRVLRGIRGRYDLVVVPGTLGYDVSGLSEDAGAPVVKGPEEPGGLLLLAEMGEEGLRRLMEGGRLEPSMLASRWLEELRERHRSAPSVEVCGVRVPVRPPPFVLAAEVYVRRGQVEEALERAEELAGRGADIVVLGFGSDWDTGEALRAVRAAADRLGGVAVDTPDRVLAAEAAAEGSACLILTLGLGDPLFEVLKPGTAVVVAPYGKGYSLPPSPAERAEKLAGLVEEARRRGLVPIADPVVMAPGLGFAASVAAYYEAARRLPGGVPIMAGLGNVYELIDADTQGQLAVLVQLFGELGASVLLVTEESRKATMAVTEAAIAATMTSLSLLKGRQPKDLGFDLLYAKEKRPAPPARLPRRPHMVLEDSEAIASWYGFRRDLRGTHLLALGEDGRIRDVYMGRRGVIELRGRRAEHIYKAVAYLGLASEPSHYAYLGYELCKAELAARMKRSYVQEADVVTPPWERGVFYSARRMRVERLKPGDEEDEEH